MQRTYRVAEEELNDELRRLIRVGDERLVSTKRNDDGSITFVVEKVEPRMETR